MRWVRVPCVSWMSSLILRITVGDGRFDLTLYSRFCALLKSIYPENTKAGFEGVPSGRPEHFSEA